MPSSVDYQLYKMFEGRGPWICYFCDEYITSPYSESQRDAIIQSNRTRWL